MTKPATEGRMVEHQHHVGHSVQQRMVSIASAAYFCSCGAGFTEDENGVYCGSAADAGLAIAMGRDVDRRDYPAERAGAPR